MKNFEQIKIGCSAALWEWLDENDRQAEAVWLVTFKKAAGPGYVSREEVLDALTAHGWIDGVRRTKDDARTMQLVSPRRAADWADSYCTRAERLLAEGKMRPSGIAAMEAAKVEGRWRTLPDVDALKVPGDLADALSSEAAADWWDRSAPSYRRNVLRWVAKAKKDATRAGRIAQVAQASARGEKLPNL